MAGGEKTDCNIHCFCVNLYNSDVVPTLTLASTKYFGNHLYIALWVGLYYRQKLFSA